jgi:hypothetical protein
VNVAHNLFLLLQGRAQKTKGSYIGYGNAWCPAADRGCCLDLLTKKRCGEGKFQEGRFAGILQSTAKKTVWILKATSAYVFNQSGVTDVFD